jgi:hypothetical protein
MYLPLYPGSWTGQRPDVLTRCFLRLHLLQAKATRDFRFLEVEGSGMTVLEDATGVVGIAASSVTFDAEAEADSVASAVYAVNPGLS